MADDGSAQSAAVWPMPKFRFELKWGAMTMMFAEVSGLDAESPAIEYRHGGGAPFNAIKMPGLTRYGNVTAKKGVAKSKPEFWNWLGEIKMNTTKRQPLTISLLDEAGAPKMVFTLANAWPTKISSTDLKSDGDEVAVEAITFAHEGLTIHSG